jgi:hypothetical protein
MFGLGNRNRRVARSGGTFGSRNLRSAAIAGLGMLAVRWWRNRQAAGRGPATGRRGDSWGTDSWNQP